LEGDLPIPQAGALRKITQKKHDFFTCIVYLYPLLLIALIALAFAAFVVTG
jgi:hypothetical protein